MSELQLFKPDQIQNLIYTVRSVQVMLDSDLARIYDVETKRLNEAVKRNVSRFPDEFRFQLTKEEVNFLLSQIAIAKKERGGRRKLPYVFTEQGVAMLSAVLRSGMANKVSVQIINAFVAMRKFIGSNAQLFRRARLELVMRRRSRTDLRIVNLCKKISSLTQCSLVAFKSSLILKDLGKKISAFSRFDKVSLKLLEKLK